MTIRTTLVRVLFAPLLPSLLAAQAPVVAKDAACARRIAVVQRARNDVQTRTAFAGLHRCGASRDAAVAQAIRVTRAAPGHFVTQQLIPLMASAPSVPVIDALIDVATDGSLPDSNRLAAMAALYKASHREYRIRAEYLSGGLDVHGIPRNGCYRGPPVALPKASTLPEPTKQRIREAASRIRRQADISADLLSAAVCLGTTG